MDPIRRCVLSLSRFPGVGEKTAQRLTWWLMRADAEVVEELAEAIAQLHEKSDHRQSLVRLHWLHEKSHHHRH